eukprot:TRINITY_DN912_c0_g1_i2.p1 TRINITY_DN912_c0_g1~~TRINITY_DN912_c0_g1_i2.p1  ORF type:complete len:233 (+),score=37.30 TRINITY_DN912_c0_g1_i2:138-836(+)
MGFSKYQAESYEGNLIIALCRLNPGADAWEREILNPALPISERMDALTTIGDTFIPRAPTQVVGGNIKSERFNHNYAMGKCHADSFFIGVRPASWPPRSEEALDPNKPCPLDEYLQQKDVLEANKQRCIRLGLALIEEASKLPERTHNRNIFSVAKHLGKWGLPFEQFRDILAEKYNYIIHEHPRDVVEVYPSFVQLPGDAERIHDVVCASLQPTAPGTSSRSKASSGCIVM